MDENDQVRAMRDRFFKSIQAFTDEAVARRDNGFPRYLWHELLNFLKRKDLGWWREHGALLEIYEDRINEKYPDLYVCVSLTLLHTYYMWLFKYHKDSPALEAVRSGMEGAEEFEFACKESEYRQLLGQLH